MTVAGDHLRMARKSAGLTQKELAGERFTGTYVSHLERGMRRWTPEVAEYFEDRLGLPGGTFMEDVDREEAKKGIPQFGTSQILGRFEDARALSESGENPQALKVLEEVLLVAADRHRGDICWLAECLRVKVEVDLGRFHDAAEHVENLNKTARRAAEAALIVRAETLAANVHRLKGDADAAVTHAAAAVRHSSRDGVTADRQCEALVAAISASNGGEDSPTWESMLAALQPKVVERTQRATAAWVLGATALGRQELEAGFEWQAEALRLLTPTGNARAWARYPRAVAESRLVVGVLDGVPEFLQLAEDRIATLDSADEVASLALTRAQYLQQSGRVSEAVGVLEQVDEKDVPVVTRAKLRMQHSELLGALGQLKGAQFAALQAAQLFSQVAATDLSNQAWQQWEELGGTTG